ncbi:unnamed protein product [Phyllotreta striolata]|uniref:G-protein coupled receptors family 1 profile domain-containing protein n=1 Tax=Phyllotreta striolata TaxID=444603 RepID=A0A9N9TRQ6_PHYSR|nr:unnamed protein product [Phyllotreta striolata]
MDEDEATSYQVLLDSRFWIQHILVPTLVCMGLVGNIITIMVLTRRRMRCSTNTYLSALACADIIHLLFGFLLSFEHYPNVHDKKYELYWRFYGLTHWLCDAASATSAWLAVSFTVERYIAVCHPMKGKIYCTERRAKNIIVIVYIFCLLTTASTTFEYQLSFTGDNCTRECFNDTSYSARSDLRTNVSRMEPANRYFHYKDVKDYDNYVKDKLKHILANCTSHPHIILVPVIVPELDRRLNATEETEKAARTIEKELEDTLNSIMSSNETNQKNLITGSSNGTYEELNATYCCESDKQIFVENTELGKSKTYMDFIYWYSAVFFAILPLLLIATFNFFLVKAVYSSLKTRRVMTNSQETVSWRNEKRITIMLIGIIFAFLICTLPTAVHLIYYHFNEPKNNVEINIRLILGNFCNFMVMLNAPCNFLIYCLLSRKFRVTFMKIFWDRRRGTQIDAETILLSSSKAKDSNKFNIYKHGLMKRNASEYRTPRDLEAHSLTSVPRSKSVMVRPIGKAKSCDLNV